MSFVAKSLQSDKLGDEGGTNVAFYTSTQRVHRFPLTGIVSPWWTRYLNPLKHDADKPESFT